MKLFYCDPRRSEQKGQIEKNHEYIRYVLPSGTSFDGLTQEKVALVTEIVTAQTDADMSDITVTPVK